MKPTVFLVITNQLVLILEGVAEAVCKARDPVQIHTQARQALYRQTPASAKNAFLNIKYVLLFDCFGFYEMGSKC